MSAPPGKHRTPGTDTEGSSKQTPGGRSTEGTTGPRQRPANRTPVVSGVLEVDLSRHTDRIGCIYSDARSTVHRHLAELPPGVAVRVRLGRAQWVADDVLDLLSERLADARAVEVVGSDDRGPAYVVPRLRCLLGAATETADSPVTG